MLVLTFLTTTTLGPIWWLASLGEDVLPVLLPSTVLRVWTTPDLLFQGVCFSVPLLLILGFHELGHSWACRKYRLPATPPFFLPAPIGLGTFGAFIKVRAPIRSRRELFDVGAAGPFAGFIVLLPFLVLGLLRSEVATGELFLLPGRSPLFLALQEGLLGHSQTLVMHPFLMAAWVGLLVTALNLLPVGQLDGGHILYACVGDLQRRLGPIVLVMLVVAGFFFWRGWWLWALIVLILGIRHPRVLDERPLDRKRQVLGVLAGLLFLLCFMPTPMAVSDAVF